MGLFDFLKSKKNKNTETVYGFASKEAESGKGLDQDQLQALRDELLSVMSTNDRNKEFNFASGLMLKGAYQACIEAYEKLTEKYPDSQATNESQIGAAYFFLGDYEKAVDYYLAARDHGMDADMMDDNLWEAFEVLYKKNGDKKHIERYLELCPGGSYVKKANKLLAK